MEEQEPFFPPSFIEELKRVFKIFLMALAMPFPYPKPDVKSGLIKASVVGLRIGIIVYGFALFIVPPGLIVSVIIDLLHPGPATLAQYAQVTMLSGLTVVVIKMVYFFFRDWSNHDIEYPGEGDPRLDCLIGHLCNLWGLLNE